MSAKSQKLGKIRSWEKLEVGKTSNNNEEFKKLENLENQKFQNQKLGKIRSWETWM